MASCKSLSRHSKTSLTKWVLKFSWAVGGVMTLFRVLYTVVHEFSVLSLEAINIARTQEATSNQLQDIRGIQTTTVNALRHTGHSLQYIKTKLKMRGVEIVEIFMI